MWRRNPVRRVLTFDHLGLAPTVTTTAMGLIANDLQTQVKQTRVFDRRFSTTEAASLA